MITQQDLQAAIAECKGQRNPNASTCIKLAAYLIIEDHLYGNDSNPVLSGYSFSAPPQTIETQIDYSSDTEFARAINGERADRIWPIIDELMSVLQATNPRLYAGVMRKIED